MPELALTFIPPPGEMRSFEPISEEERLRRIFTEEIFGSFALPTVPAEAYDWGVLIVKLTPTVGPIIGTAVGAWLHARYGRKVRLKVGDIEAEAQTREEVEKLLAKAQEIQQHDQPKKIHEP